MVGSRGSKLPNLTTALEVSPSGLEQGLVVAPVYDPNVCEVAHARSDLLPHELGSPARRSWGATRQGKPTDPPGPVQR
jgi:hypothetical protein